MRPPPRAVLAAAVARAGAAHGAALEDLLKRHGKPDTPVAVAVSGGADSVLALLAVVAVCGAPRTVALHFNHALRGAASDADARYVAALARALGVRCRGGRWRAAGRAGQGEDGSRRARLRFLERAARATGAAVVVLGHHARDVAESQLLALARGAPASALAAPLPVSVVGGLVLLRPLLATAPEAIRSLLRAVGVPWREDRSNDDRAFTRNRLRLDVVPAWLQAVPQDGYAGALRTRGFAEEEEEALQAWVDRAGFGFGAARLDLPAERPPAAVLRRALRRWLANAGRAGDVRAAVADAVVDAWLGGRVATLDVGPREHLAVDAAGVTWVRRAAPARARRGEAVLTPGAAVTWEGGALWCDVVAVDRGLLARLRAGGVDPAVEVFLAVPVQPPPVLRVRTWQPGDTYRPLGAPGRTKLHDQFINRRIPAERRRRLPVVDLDGRILWCPGLPPAEEARVLVKTRRAVRLTYRA